MENGCFIVSRKKKKTHKSNKYLVWLSPQDQQILGVVILKKKEKKILKEKNLGLSFVEKEKPNISLVFFFLKKKTLFLLIHC